jgi:hypothetical protein
MTVSRAWEVPNLDPNASTAVNARRVLAVRTAEFYSYTWIVPFPEYTEALHNLRIAAKRLRYSLELFRPQIGASGERQIERVKAIQEALGTLHDHDVRIALIGDELTKLAVEQSREAQAAIAEASPNELPGIAASTMRPPPDDPRRGLMALLGREHEARRAAYAEFRARWEQLAGEGFRSDLVALSALRLDATDRSISSEGNG